MRDLFDRIIENKGPLGKWASIAEGYFVFPKLEGPESALYETHDVGRNRSLGNAPPADKYYSKTS